MLARLHKRHIVAKPGFNRWLIAPASVFIHLCIGSVYAWSMFNPPLVRQLGVVASAADDWRFASVVWIFSTAIVFLGLAAAIGGKWLEQVGPRATGFLAACLWGGGFLISSLGLYSHELWLIYLGYGVIGGCGLGLAYVTPVSTLIRWFPDRRGMATGIAIMGFGGGAIIGAPLKGYLLSLFYEAPTYLGKATDLSLITENGRRFVESAGEKIEVVVTTAKDMAALPVPGPEGVYVVGSGTTGAATVFLILGVVYFLVMTIAAFSFRVPPANWKPAGWNPDTAKKPGKSLITQNHVHIDQALKTPQFYQLWIMLCFNVTAGIGVIGVAKTMITDIFEPSLPSIVDAGFAATYVLMISVFNMAGRFFWSSLSDYISRQTTYSIFFMLGALLYLSIPLIAMQASVSPSVMWLVLFYAFTMLIFTMYGGGFATIPAYLADIFGTLHVGGIHGRLLTAWSAAGVLGPVLLTQLRENSIYKAIHELASTVDPTVFMNRFGAPISELDTLIASSTVSINAMMEIAPAGTVDPTPSLYNTTMYVMAALLIVALISNRLMRPVDSKHHVQNSHAAWWQKEQADKS
ncbi:Permeases of the major facilitator superfamily [Methylophaga frappieri]|uniref:Permeases of the major facilitator superfamily n=1 Tax=Methylophaga frappieri (strain ATCC BAA-2434 / DSM 25690 / JAM7) TaxID=754477 RepID=I1YI75_METFJ|nr:OFA family MFS transporter [Methylophaga frappieri]AFJ02618.1 Permeases of the major facilitator superfamily [Methylophaga frappieri]